MMRKTAEKKITAFAVGAAIIMNGALADVTFAQTATGYDVDLTVGSTGADVAALQTYLAADPSLYPEGLVTGNYGTLTRAAVMLFQERYGIAQVGRVGPITRAKLNELIGAPTGGTAGGVGGSDDISAPVMGVETVTVDGTNVMIRWGTNEPTFSRVMYGTTWPFLYAAAPSARDDLIYDTDQALHLTGLLPNTLYYFVRESVDAPGNVSLSVAKSFMTGRAGADVPAPATATDTTAPTMSAISIGSIGSTSVTVTFTTNEAATTQVFLATTPSVAMTTPYYNDIARVTSHSALLSGLASGARYYYVVRSTDTAGNTTTSTEGSFMTNY